MDQATDEPPPLAAPVLGLASEQKAFKVSKNTLQAVTKDRRKITKGVKLASHNLGGG